MIKIHNIMNERGEAVVTKEGGHFDVAKKAARTLLPRTY